MRPRRRILRARGGFTLVEVLVASLLLLVAVIPILKALNGSFMATAYIQQKTHSLRIAQSKLEEIRARSLYTWGSFGAYNETAASFGAYRYKVTDTLHASQEYRTITIEAGFDKDGDNQLENNEVLIELVTIIARRD